MPEITEGFVHPKTKELLQADVRGGLHKAGDPGNILFEKVDGIHDFLPSNRTNEEREYYDDFYNHPTDALAVLTRTDLLEAWDEVPGFKQLLHSVGDLSGKKVLLIGNGTSLKELYFLFLGARCVYTDLSVQAVFQIKTAVEKSPETDGLLDQIEFHAVDACELPFPDRSFDLIYGSAIVHHIEDPEALFSEVSRCLGPGGICRFLDAAYSPLWQGMKNTILKPLQLYTHRKQGISPEDLRDTKKGGYRFEEIDAIRQKFGFHDMLFDRVSFFEYLFWRGTLKLGGKFLRFLLPLLHGLDLLLKRYTSFMRKQGIRLVWGFTKPFDQ